MNPLVSPPQLDPADVVIVEGILVLAMAEVGILPLLGL